MKIFQQILTAIFIAALLPSLVVFFTLVQFERHHRTSKAVRFAQNEELFSGNIEGGPSGLIVVYDLESGKVRHSNTPMIDNVYNSLLLVRSHLPSNGKTVKANFSGNSYEGICRPIRNGQLGECRLVHETMLGDAVTSVTRIVIGIILFSAVAVIIMAYKLSVRISNPVESLSNCIRSMPDNDYKFDYPIKGNSEFDLLAQQLKSACSKIKEYKNEIVNKSRQAALGQMSSHIAHDMRSPLSVLKGYVGLEGGIIVKVSEEYRSAAARSVDKLIRMADGLVDYAKASKIERSIVVFDKFIHDSVMLETRARASEGRTRIEYDTSANIQVNIDVHKIGRVLVNLVDNGVQSISHDRGEVSVRAAVQNENDLVISIIDNGKGIESEHLPHIFDTLYTTGKRDGTGLGLSYCRQVIEAHGGTIGVQSVVGKGTAFTIRIPGCVIFDNEKQVRQVEAVAEETLAASGQAAKNFLIVDDDAEMRSQWERIIDENGGRLVCSAASVEEVQQDDGIDYSRIDAAVVDYRYEGFQLTGIDLIAFLKQKGIKEIHLCTGYYYEKDICRRAAKAGADSVIPKPIDDNSVSRLFS